MSGTAPSDTSEDDEGIVVVTAEMARKALEEMDWTAIDAMSEEEIRRRAESDPDSKVYAPGEIQRRIRDGRMRMVYPYDTAPLRRRLGLSQTAFTDRFRIPVHCIRDWEQGRSGPDRATRAYLAVIEAESETIARILRDADPADLKPPPRRTRPA